MEAQQHIDFCTSMIYSDDQFYSLGKKMKFLEMWYQSTEFAVFINPNAKSVEKMLKKKKMEKIFQ